MIRKKDYMMFYWNSIMYFISSFFILNYFQQPILYENEWSTFYSLHLSDVSIEVEALELPKTSHKQNELLSYKFTSLSHMYLRDDI